MENEASNSSARERLSFQDTIEPSIDSKAVLRSIKPKFLLNKQVHENSFSNENNTTKIFPVKSFNDTGLNFEKEIESSLVQKEVSCVEVSEIMNNFP